MADRFDCVAFKKRGDRTIPVRLGSAVKRTQGDGWNVYLDCIPAPADGQYQFSIVPPRPRERPAEQADHGEEPPW